MHSISSFTLEMHTRVCEQMACCHYFVLPPYINGLLMCCAGESKESDKQAAQKKQKIQKRVARKKAATARPAAPLVEGEAARQLPVLQEGRDFSN